VRQAGDEPGHGPGEQLSCAAGNPLGPCPPQYHYPEQTKITVLPLPPLPTMPDPCRGTPRNAFCSQP
jgi:hypothetical protein